MKTLLLLTALLFLGAAKPPLPSIAPLTIFGGRAICTTFSINEQRHYWLTAQHCVRARVDYFVAGESAYVVDRDELDDLAVLKTGRGAPAVPVADSLPVLGSLGITLGWPHGELVPSMGTLASHDARLMVRGDGWFDLPHFNDYMLFAMPVWGGHSGSPIFVDGKLVSVAQVGSARWTGGVRFTVLRKYLASYLK